ncbi:Aerobic cobaltochelatase subunit CobN [Novipirellula aureliae]|uniref:Aerobic cobaltochelatase subunit CobN n=1 Tax=Novipirellula aureliae TaxID=2527966 RepID=A0A5C6DLF0_9BACT|nr:cobaltochelatase subunit CobN [Novipirellula aureliae]TWU35739.1 Aerobic cobaltochelatase subunit CobN [Novipirellula aureliae]
MYRRSIVAAVLFSLCLTTGLWAYHRYLRAFRVAVIHFDDTGYAAWHDAIDETSYTLHRYDRDQLDTIPLDHYNLVVIRAMGLNLTDQQVAAFESARQSGTEIFVILPTNDRSREQTSLDETQKSIVDEYLRHGGKENLVNMFHYVAREFGGREVEIKPVIEKPQKGLFHLGDVVYESLEEYDTFLDQRRPFASDAARITLAGPFLDPSDTLNRDHIDRLISSFENSGVRVYPLFGHEELIERIEATQPDLVITFPHGRMASGNVFPRLFKRLDCPCVSALSLMDDSATWMDDPRGMSAGFMGQSITTPEVDGVIEPLVISSVDPNEREIRVRTPIDDRVQKRVSLALNWIKLRKKANADKRVVIVYYKAPGLAALSAGDLEVVPSLYNTLKRMQREGYDFGGQLPDSPAELEQLIQTRGKTLGQWAIGSYENFLTESQPEFVPAQRYAEWFSQALSPKRQQETIDLWGNIPGKQMVTQQDGQSYLVVSRIQLGNVVIMPQPTVGGGGKDEDEVASIHGTDQAAPHFYLGAYLWARYGFDADAIVHYGTHGSLEFTYGKSVALSRDCWPDILIGDVPHIYPYVINNIGEAVIAKRRSNAVIVSHLTTPFATSELYGDLSMLHDKIHDWEAAVEPGLKEETRRSIGNMVAKLNLASDLGFDEASDADQLLSDEQLDRVHNYLHVLKDQSIGDGLHVIGRPYEEEQVETTVMQMIAPDAVDVMLEALGLHAYPDVIEFRSELTTQLVSGVLRNTLNEESLFGTQRLKELRESIEQKAATSQASSSHGYGPPAGHSRPRADGGKPETSLLSEAEKPKHASENLPELDTDTILQDSFWNDIAPQRIASGSDTKIQIQLLELIDSIRHDAEGLRQSPAAELDQFIVALRGGYIEPSSGGDPIGNPASVPTGRNLYAINADMAPSDEAWTVGCRLADELLASHQARTGHLPRRVAFSLWGGEFIRGKGTTLAQILYLMGVRPMRNSRSGVFDVEIIPAEELGRPRIDVLVQTSGQFRDIAASRISLIDKAVNRVSRLPDESIANYVRDGSNEAEAALKEQGMSPKEARLYATARIFGAAENRSYGTDIMGLVEKGDTWEDEKEIADRYIQNMGGIYRDGATWGTYKPGVFASQMKGTELVVHPRSSNSWGPLSLDHVYEFMGGMSMAVRNKTGHDPTAVFNDLRRRGRAKSTTAVEAIREEARTTMWNPKFITGMQREGGSAAASLTESVRNLHGWNVMQPASISEDMWDETYKVYIEDKHDLGMREYFEQKNPYALQNMTAIMLETARKGYWQPPEDILQNLATVHAELVSEFGAGCSYETCGNGKLQDFINAALIAPGSEAPAELETNYQASLASVLQSAEPMPEVEGMTMEERIEETPTDRQPINRTDALPLACGLALGILSLTTFGFLGRRRSF